MLMKWFNLIFNPLDPYQDEDNCKRLNLRQFLPNWALIFIEGFEEIRKGYVAVREVLRNRF